MAEKVIHKRQKDPEKGGGCEHTPTNYSWLRRKRAKVGAAARRAVYPHGLYLARRTLSYGIDHRK